jgi:phage/plasmid-associated DNA primase
MDTLEQNSFPNRRKQMWTIQEVKSFQKSSLEINASELYAKYRMWCAENGEKPTSAKKFGSMMTAYGLEREHNRDGWYYLLKK